MEKSEKKKWIGNGIIIAGLVLACLIAKWWATSAGLGVMGMAIFIVALIGVNILSEKHELTTGEVRKSIAIAFTVVFFGLFFLESYPPKTRTPHRQLLEGIWCHNRILLWYSCC